MVTLSRQTRGKLLSMLARCGNVIAPPDNAGLHVLVDTGQARVDQLFHNSGRKSAHRLWRLTGAGHDWLQANGFGVILESTNAPRPDAIEEALRAAIMALRSYQHGNAAPDLAASTADAGDAALRAAGLAPATLGAR